MAFKGSGSVKVSEIRNHFGGSASDKFSEYYRGGTYVPDTTPNASIPTSGTIKVSDFYSSSNAVVTCPNKSYTKVDLKTATASVTLHANKTITGVDGTSGSWGNSEIVASDWDVRATVTGDTAFASGTFNTWLAMTVDHTWSVGASSPAGPPLEHHVVITFQFRDLNNKIWDTATVDLNAFTTFS